MKKIIIAAALLFSMSAFAAPTTIDQKVVKKFTEFFPSAQSIKWYDGQSYYLVSFMDKDMLQRVYYDLEGNVFRTIRYYDGSKLCPFIALKVKDAYRNKTIKGVTEVQEDSGLVYQIILQDEKHMYVVNCNSDGDLNLQKRFKRG